MSDIKYIHIQCANCGMPFAVPDFQVSWLKAKGKSFCCPAGHIQSFTEDTELEKLKVELNQKQKELDRAWEECKERADIYESLYRSHRSLRGVITRMKGKKK